MSTPRSLFQLPSFRLAMGIAVILILWIGYFIITDTDATIKLTSDGLSLIIDDIGIALMILAFIVPVVVLTAANHRFKQLAEQMQQQEQQNAFANHYLHVAQFTDYMNDELMKRLGMNSRVVHQVFYPQSRENDFTVNDNLVKFIKSKLVEIVQASKVVNQLYGSQDGDEKAVAQNRVEFAMAQSVGLMVFLAGQVNGGRPECQDFHFLKDAMADYLDVINALIGFDGVSDGTVDLSDFYQLFNIQEVKSWFTRNDNFLRLCCEQNERDDPLVAELAQW